MGCAAASCSDEVCFRPAIHQQLFISRNPDAALCSANCTTLINEYVVNEPEALDARRQIRSEEGTREEETQAETGSPAQGASIGGCWLIIFML